MDSNHSYIHKVQHKLAVCGIAVAVVMSHTDNNFIKGFLTEDIILISLAKYHLIKLLSVWICDIPRSVTLEKNTHFQQNSTQECTKEISYLISLKES